MPISQELHDTADRIVRRYPVARSALLPLLHLVQSEQNHVTEEGIAFCAEKVGLTRAEVGAVSTFYTMYKREPVGDWLLSVCTNPTCKQKGGQEIYENYLAALGGHSDPETRVTVEHAECLGICDGAPVVQVNYEMFGPLTVAEGDQLLAACRSGQPPVSPWSGEQPPTFAEVERDLSGANDVWESQLHAAALAQIQDYEHPPTYRTGETDLPVTHPGGDPAGVGGELFRSASAGTATAARPTGTTTSITDEAPATLEVPDEPADADAAPTAPTTGAEDGTAAAPDYDSAPPAAGATDDVAAVPDEPMAAGTTEPTDTTAPAEDATDEEA